MKKLLTLTGLLLGSLSINAEPIDVEYKSFYSHIRKLEQEDTQGLQFAFGFMHIDTGKLCGINDATIVTPKQSIPLDVTAEQRFTVPSEKALKLADAIVRVDLTEPSNKCDMSVQLETKPSWLKQNYTSDDLRAIYDQYSAFFNEMGSFLSFLMPSVKGLMIHFEDKQLTQQVGQNAFIRQGVLILDDDALASLKTLSLPVSPQRITALATR